MLVYTTGLATGYLFPAIVMLKPLVHDNPTKEVVRMDELTKLVAQKAGITPEQAKAAIQTVLDFIKQKLPAPIASQIDGVLSGSAGGDIAKGLGGLLGK
jgi:hypothetical protein